MYGSSLFNDTFKPLASKSAPIEAAAIPFQERKQPPVIKILCLSHQFLLYDGNTEYQIMRVIKTKLRQFLQIMS